MKVNHEQLQKLTKIAYEKKLPLMILGAIGIGKSSSIKQTAMEIAKEQKLEFCDVNNYSDESKFHLIDIRISQLEPTDLRGLPNFDHETKTTKWYAPNWLPTVGKGIMFFDEINLAPPSIQSACYQLILDRKLGDYKLPDGYLVIAAGNRLEDRANTFDLSAPLANRFIHCELDTPKVNAWTDWALQNKVDARITSFLNFRNGYLYKFNDKSKDNAFPTPRSWEMASNLIKDKSARKEIELLSSTAIGEGTAIEFATFVDMQSKVDIQAILKNPEKAELPEEIDKRYAIISAIAEHYREHKKILPQVLLLANKIDIEYGTLMLKLCRSYDSSDTAFREKLAKTKEFDKIVTKYGKYLI